MTTLDCVEERVGGSAGAVGKAVGNPLVKRWKSVGIYPLNGKADSVRFPVRGHILVYLKFAIGLPLFVVVVFSLTNFGCCLQNCCLTCKLPASYTESLQ